MSRFVLCAIAFGLGLGGANAHDITPFTGQAPKPGALERLNSERLPEAARKAVRSIVIRDNLWQRAPTVCFGPVASVGARGELIAKIMKIADEWTERTNITFDWGAPAPRVCTGINSADIRVYIAPPAAGPLFISLIGNNSASYSIADDYGQNYAPYSVALEFPNEGSYLGTYYLRDEVMRFYVLHEFGHALGFEHEHQRIDCNYNWQYVKAKFNFASIQDAKDNMKKLNFPSGAFPNNDAVIDGKFIMTKYDNYSVMKYNLNSGTSSPAGDDPQVYVEGTQSPCYRPGWVSQLSEFDHTGAVKAYAHLNVAVAAISRNLTAEQPVITTRSFSLAAADEATAKAEEEINAEIAAVRKSPRALKLVKQILAEKHKHR